MIRTWDMRTGSRDWQVRRDTSEDEQQRRAILNGPPPKNDPILFKATRCRVLRSFCVKGKPLPIGSECTLPRHDALSLAAANKVELLDEGHSCR